MPTRAVFRCQFCDAVPDHGTQRSLAGQVSERMFGEYLDAFPGRWLVWNGGGPLGPRRYACREHRGDLVAYLRYHYATVAAQVWKMPPYTARWPDEKRPHMGGSMGIIKFGLRGGLLQDRRSGDAAGESAAARAPKHPDSTGEPTATPTPAPAADAADPSADVRTRGPGEDAPTAAAGDRASDTDPSGEQTPRGAVEPEADPPAGADAALSPQDDLAGMSQAGDLPEDPFPPGALLGADEWDPADGLFPPGELFLPTDGPFAPGAGPGWGEPSEGDDRPWPPLDGPSEDDDGPWPTAPGSPPA
jgi:hypothetical protein